MALWWKLALLIALLGGGNIVYGTTWDFWSWLQKTRDLESLPCSAELLGELFQKGSLRGKFSRQGFLRFAAEMPRRFGLSPEFVSRRYQTLIDHPELVELMGGIDLAETIGDGLSVSAAWGADYNFLPNYAHWQMVRDNLPALVARMEKKLHLDPILGHQLFAADETTVSDSGWVIVSTKRNGRQIDSTIKVTFFDYETTPDGGWPRYHFESLLTPHKLMYFRKPRELSDYEASLVEEGLFTLKSSLDYWGLFPSELQTGYRFSEHEGVFSQEYLMKHRLMMTELLDSFGKKEVTERLQEVEALRRQIPPAAREMAELQRFNIPAGAPPASKAQVFYGLTVLLSLRPIKTVVALSPRPVPPPGQVAVRPSFEVGSVQPGWEFLADIAREVASEMDREAGISEEPLADPARDPLREMYEDLGLEVVATYPYVMGLPNGAHIYRSPRDRFLRKIIEYQENHSAHLTPTQLITIGAVKRSLVP